MCKIFNGVSMGVDIHDEIASIRERFVDLVFQLDQLKFDVMSVIDRMEVPSTGKTPVEDNCEHKHLELGVDDVYSCAICGHEKLDGVK